MALGQATTDYTHFNAGSIIADGSGADKAYIVGGVQKAPDGSLAGWMVVQTESAAYQCQPTDIEVAAGVTTCKLADGNGTEITLVVNKTAPPGQLVDLNIVSGGAPVMNLVNASCAMTGAEMGAFLTSANSENEA